MLSLESQYRRFSGAPWFDNINNSKIIVFGQGGIGSWLSFFLARTGASLFVVDMDTVEDHNLGGQLYGEKQIGKPKVEAIKEVIENLCTSSVVNTLNCKVEDDETSDWYSYLAVCDVVCVSFDNLPTRKLVFEKWKKNGKEGSLFVDGRMSMVQGNVLTVRKGNEEDYHLYEDSFFSEGEAAPLPCSAKATSHCGALTASLMTAQITNWFTDKGDFSVVNKQLDFYLPIMEFENINKTCITVVT